MLLLLLLLEEVEDVFSPDYSGLKNSQSSKKHTKQLKFNGSRYLMNIRSLA